MSTQEIINYYASLLILQYLGQVKAVAHIKAIVSNVIMDQLPAHINAGFEITTAVGAQLDVIGKYVGVSRVGNTFTGPVTLDDSDFRILIQVKIISNNSGSSLYDIQQLIWNAFGNQIIVFDFQSMQMSYWIDPSLGSTDLAQVLVTQGLLPKPMAVGLSVVYAPTNSNFFGFRTYNYQIPLVSPFNSYTAYQTDRPWISYANAL